MLTVQSDGKTALPTSAILTSVTYPTENTTDEPTTYPSGCTCDPELYPYDQLCSLHAAGDDYETCGYCGNHEAGTACPEEPLTPGAFCDFYEAHEPHVYVALNAETYSCPGLSAGELEELDAYDPGTCEHGLSADLCSGPMHYPADF